MKSYAIFTSSAFASIYCDLLSVVTFIRQLFSNITAIGVFSPPLVTTRHNLDVLFPDTTNHKVIFIYDFFVGVSRFPLFTYSAWHLTQYDWFIPSMRLQVIQDPVVRKPINLIQD